ncbi:hypothetical protein P872_14280 [Rhodonellum psychrophilum GCM71 = DSM 17998]|uniref:Uncharacterized protein n=1 Tax=Rhodonellum psychrophilum GCM71 = DSM 17998 TaxID=1123057 RepID=U5BIG6_9BACT|nr:hypothetical protein P872_14280 [Rhodonellum psychrophilum GCM71 = DSM 17998]
MNLDETSQFKSLSSCLFQIKIPLVKLEKNMVFT